MIRPYSYEARALSRGLHQVRYLAKVVEGEENPVKLQLDLVRKVFNEVLLLNSNAGRDVRPPLVYKQVIETVESVLQSRGQSCTAMFQGSSYFVSGKKENHGGNYSKPRGGGRQRGSHGGGGGHGGGQEEKRQSYKDLNNKQKKRGQLCNVFNGGGDCDGCDRLHLCDAKLPSGKPCRGDHQACDHEYD